MKIKDVFENFNLTLTQINLNLIKFYLFDFSRLITHIDNVITDLCDNDILKAIIMNVHTFHLLDPNEYFGGRNFSPTQYSKSWF